MDHRHRLILNVNSTLQRDSLFMVQDIAALSATIQTL